MPGPERAPVKLSSVVDASRYVPSATASTLTVGVRVRPLIRAEIAKGGRKDIIRVIDGRVVIVLDPDENKDYLDQVQNRTKEKRFTFDIAFGVNCTNRDVYNGTVRDLVGGVLQGINTTVFAYGATGSGKTYTMVGSPNDPGLMVLCLEKIFADRDTVHRGEDLTVTCSYLEVYNEVIYDLLVRSSSPLELREDPELGVVVAGLKHITVDSPSEIMTLLEEGNRRRKTEATDANASSSRSHAVLEITVKRTPKNHYKVTQLRGKLCLVDLAGSERAAETNNAGQKLRDGANINRSLLALANCINALGKAGKAASYVPYRNSKLTRLLKDGLSGNSRTAMVATVSAASDQYHHSINTLKYADRAKEIKTHVVQNVGTVESHVADYQKIIDNLQTEVQDLRAQLVEREAARPVGQGPRGARTSEEDLLVLIGKLVEQMNDNIEERINLQKALFEIEDANLYNKHELSQLDEFLEAGKGNAKDIAEARERRAEVLEATRENDRERERFKAEISANEVARRDIQGRVQSIVDSNQSAAFLNLLSTFRLQALHLQELKFQMAVRDQIISEQRQVIGNLWTIIDKSGLPRDRILEVARAEGILMDGLLGGDGGPPTVGPVPLSEALKAVKQEIGLPDNPRATPDLTLAVALGQAAGAQGQGRGRGGAGAGGGKRGAQRQLRYRAWPAPSQADHMEVGRSASADTSPYHSDGGGGADDSDDDTASVRSDKSPLRGRGHVPHHKYGGPGNGGHRAHSHPANVRRRPSDVGGGGAAAAVGAAAAAVAARKGQGVTAAPAAQGNAGAAAAAKGRRRIPMGPADSPGPPSYSPGAVSPGAGPVSGLGSMGSAPLPSTSTSTPPVAPPPPPTNAPSQPQLTHIKSGRRAGQHRLVPPSDLGELPGGGAGHAAAAGGAAGGGGGVGQSAFANQGAVPALGIMGLPPRNGRRSDTGQGAGGYGGAGGGGGGGPLADMPPLLPPGGGGGVQAGLGGLEGRGYGRRRHTVANGGVGQEGRGDEGDEGQYEGQGAPPGLQRNRSDLGRGAGGYDAPPPVPPVQPPLNERLARLKGRMSNVGQMGHAANAAVAAAGQPGGGMSGPPQMLHGVALGVAR